jgi:predicted RNA-binding Zn-ribbon protein involved in translation (DUF1610 family)
MGRRKQEELEVRVVRAAANQRAKLVASLLQPGELLASDPATCLLEVAYPASSERSCAGKVVRRGGFLFATDRRLLFRTENAQLGNTWPYQNVATHELSPCTYDPFFRRGRVSVRPRVKRRDFATLAFETKEGAMFAAHGSRPYLEAIDVVLTRIDIGTLPRTPTTTAIYARAEAVRCASCRTSIETLVEFCPGCGRTIDWEEARRRAERIGARPARNGRST